jgi:hypothetical protein
MLIQAFFLFWYVELVSKIWPQLFTPGTHFIVGWVDPRAGLDDMEKWKFFTLPGLELPLPLVVQPVVSRYTDWAIPAPTYQFVCMITRKYFLPRLVSLGVAALSLL